jgi:hypothetical protein
MFGNHQRTSTRNGILKAEATLRFAQTPAKHGIEHLQDMVDLSTQREHAVKAGIYTPVK